MDDWKLSTEELDALERDALQQLAKRNYSSLAATTSNSKSNSPNMLPANFPSCLSSVEPTFLSEQLDKRSYSSSVAATTSNSNGNRPKLSSLPENVPSSRSPAKPTFLSGPPLDDDKARVLPSSVVPYMIDNPSKQQFQKITIKFFLHASGNIAAKFPYDKVLVGVFHNIPRAKWNSKERLWTFPLSSLSTAESLLRDVHGTYVEIENLDPLVKRALVAATSVPDLQDRYDKIPISIEARLLPFQRDGVRFILQHGGRILLADEMGLGKTLQAIAVTSCIREAWPVLVLTPSSLRLHWASMIQQWLDIAPSDILC